MDLTFCVEHLQLWPEEGRKAILENGKTDKAFWSRYAKLYDFEISRFSRAAYAEMYRLMAQALGKEMRVLEIATGTGLIAINIAASVHSVEAIDFAPGMIKKAQKKAVPAADRL